jgi:hypothetical protein
MVWMPYHRIQFNYTRSERGLIQRYGETGRGETALNAMFCGSVKSERELFMLFRPNYLKHKKVRHSPQSEEVVGPTVYTDFDGVLMGFLKRLNGVKDELNELRSSWRKNYVRIRRRSMILPLPRRELKEKEKKFSKKAAELSAAVYTLNMCLNTNEDMTSIKVTGYDIFYYPTLVVTLKHKENGTERYLIINLVKGGLIRKRLSCDRGLTELCSKNSAFKEVVTGLITSCASQV